MFVILSVCLLSSPATCKEERVRQSVDQQTPIGCLVEGQNTVAQWGIAHPQWHIDKWKCVSGDQLPSRS